MQNNIYEDIIKKMADGGIQSPRLEARLLIGFVLKIDPNDAPLIKSISIKEKEELDDFINKRLCGMPLDKILGQKSFYKYDFKVSENVLSPRPDTEILVEEAIKKTKAEDTILELGVGSGCVLLSILKETRGTQGIGIDVSIEALKIAKENAKSLELEQRCRFIEKNWNDDDFNDCFDNIKCANHWRQPVESELTADFQSDWQAQLGGNGDTSGVSRMVLHKKVDIIVSNPPYIKTEEIKTLDREVRLYDPLIALDGGADGLDCYRKIAKICQPIVQKEGYILLEVGAGQAQDVEKIFLRQGWAHEQTVKDLAGIKRVVILKNK